MYIQTAIPVSGVSNTGPLMSKLSTRLPNKLPNQLLNKILNEQHKIITACFCIERPCVVISCCFSVLFEIIVFSSNYPSFSGGALPSD